MAFTRLVDGWNRTRRQRTPLPWGRRVGSMEADLGADMTPGRNARWEHLPMHDGPEHEDVEHQPDEHQPDEPELELEDDEVEP